MAMYAIQFDDAYGNVFTPAERRLVEPWVTELTATDGLDFQYNMFGEYCFTLQHVIQKNYMDKLTFQHVVYDEVETFRPYNDD